MFRRRQESEEINYYELRNNTWKNPLNKTELNADYFYSLIIIILIDGFWRALKYRH